MIKIENYFKNEKAKAELVSRCEADFEARLDEVCRRITESRTRIIALSGPTCSGKTTTAGKLTEALTKSGYEVHLVSIDNFFREREDLDRESIMKNGTVDYDSVNAIDLGLLAERAASIIAGEPTELPVYDFKLGRATHSISVDPNDHSVFIFEGIQAIYPEVTALFGNSYKSVYICVEDDISIKDELYDTDVFFGKRELRLLRRLVRDYNFRGAAPEFTFFLWRSVTANEDRSILPYADTADIRINSFMEYEIFLMKSVLPEILEKVPESNPYFVKAYELLQKLKWIQPIGCEHIPESSVLREFIG